MKSHDNAVGYLLLNGRHSAQKRGAVLPMLCWLLLSQVVISQAATPVYPLKQSANGRYLVDSVGAPVLIVGDAPHSILANIGTNGWQTYFQNRGSNGVNNVWIELLCDEYTFGYGHESAANYGKDFYGNNPFTSTLSGSYYDLTTPNPAYWSNVDYVVAQAASNGVQCFLTPLDQGGWTQTSLANGTDQCYAYGQFLGNRYKNSPNIIWNLGNDFQNWTNATNDSVILAIADGIRSVDSNHLLTIQLNYPVSQSMNDPNWASRISINGVYTYYGTYDESQLAYNITNLPTLFLEAHYEDEDVGGALGTPNVLRRQEYWSLLSGCLAGHMYGSYWIDRFDPAWVSHLDSPGMVQLTYFKDLFSSRAWYNLVPDTNHVLVTAGYGTYNGNLQPGDSDYATAARTPDGTLGVVYTPVRHTLTVALSGFTNNVTARWFDPTANTFTAIDGSPLVNAGTYNFTPPANNAAGDSDWVLLLETEGGQPLSAATWEMTVKGPAKATCVLKLSEDGILQGSGIEQSLCGPFTVTGTWSQASSGSISGVFTETFPALSCLSATSITGTFIAKPSQKSKTSATALDSRGKSTWAVRIDQSFPSMPATWQAVLTVGKTQRAETLDIIPSDTQPGWFDIQGQSNDASYTLTGAMIVTSRKAVTAYIVRDLPSGPVASFYTGKFNPSKGVLQLKGLDATGAKHKLKASAG
jgi:hypothetical protein